MKRTTLRSSTALAMSALLAVPAPGFAAGHIPICGDPVEPICLDDEDGTLLVPAPGDQLEPCEAAGPPCRVEPGLVRLELESPRAQNALAAAGMADGNATAEVEGDAEMTGESEVETETEMADGDATAEVEGDAEMGEESSAEAETEMADGDATAEVEGDAEMAEESEAEAEAETETEMADGDATAEVEGDAEVEAVAEGLAEDSGEAEMADGDATAETEGDGELVQIGEEGGSDSSEGMAQVEESADTDSEMTDATDDATDGEIAAEAAPETMDESDVAASDDSVESQPVEGTGAVAAEAAAETQAPAAAAAAAEGDTEANVEVATEEVTEDTARSSDEDFETAAVGDAPAESSTAAGDDDRGLSNFEKALILGLGAVAVGSVLNNGDEVVSNSGDRVVVRRNGELQVLKDDDALLRQPGAQVRTETFDDGSTRTTVIREDGTRIVTIRGADGRVLRRARVFEDGSQVVLFDDTAEVEPVDVASLPEVQEERESVSLAEADEEALRRALDAAMVRDTGRTYSLRQVRQIREVRELAPEIELDAITFATGSAAIQPSQAEELTALGRAMRDIILDNPGEVFLVEGHTDTVGDATLNLALSDRRAETVALALAEYFEVPPENMVTQGYGESQLKVRQEGDIRANRRATVRRITPLLTASN